MNNETPVDEESKKLLADLAEQDKTPTSDAPASGAADTKLLGGIPWDARIHAGTKTTVANGTEWKKKQGVDKDTVESVTAELLNQMGTSATTGEDTAPVVEKSDDNTVTNISKNPRRIGGTTVPVGGSYTLTEQDLDNEILCKKVDHAIALGLFSHGAD